MNFPKRYRPAKCEGYPDLTFHVLANPTGAWYDAFLAADTETDERAQELGAMLCEAYQGEKLEAYGAVLDFSTGASAVALLSDDSLPIDLRRWIRNAPIGAVQFERDEHGKNYEASFNLGK